MLGKVVSEWVGCGVGKDKVFLFIIDRILVVVGRKQGWVLNRANKLPIVFIC